MTKDPLRLHLIDLLDGKGAHTPFDDAVKDFPAHLRGVKPPGAPYSAWQLLEHLRIAQWDIVEFSIDAKHESPPWPEGYWPKSEAPKNEPAWGHSIAAFKVGLDKMKALIADDLNDLFARIPHGSGQTLLREALILADHNSYHLGQMVLLRKLLNAWPE